MRKMSKKAKVEAYDALASEAHAMRMVLHDIGTGKKPDEISGQIADHPRLVGETVAVKARAYRLGGAEGGYILLTWWTHNTDGTTSSKSVRVVRLDDLMRETVSRGDAYSRACYAVCESFCAARKDAR